jgi:hypothetical protein
LDGVPTSLTFAVGADSAAAERETLDEGPRHVAPGAVERIKPRVGAISRLSFERESVLV